MKLVLLFKVCKVEPFQTDLTLETQDGFCLSAGGTGPFDKKRPRRLVSATKPVSHLILLNAVTVVRTRSMVA